MSVHIQQDCASDERRRDTEVHLWHFKDVLQSEILTGGSLFIREYHYVTPIINEGKFASGGSLANQKGKAEHNTLVPRICTAPFLGKIQNLTSTPASSSKRERQKRILAADESESTILIHPTKLSSIYFILKGSDKIQQQFFDIICISCSLS